jgi:hypothetical protein
MISIGLAVWTASAVWASIAGALIDRDLPVWSGSGRRTLENLHRLNHDPVKARVCQERTRRNLIVVLQESQELGSLGLFNPSQPNLAPFLSGVAGNSTVFYNYDVVAYTGWSLGSLVAAQCGIPEVGGHKPKEAKEHVNPRGTCLGDILHAANVSLFSVLTNEYMVGFSDLFRNHKWVDVDSTMHGVKHDFPTLHYIDSTIFPKLEKLNDDGKPWVLIWATEGVHMVWPYVDPQLPNRVGPRADVVLRSFDQVDQVMELLFKLIRRSGFANTTDIFMYGDHRHVMSPKWLAGQRRRELMMLPLHEKRLVLSPTSAYDVGPTILDMLGVCHEPKFVWGRSLVSDPEGRPSYPRDDDFVFVANEFGIRVGLQANVEPPAWNDSWVWKRTKRGEPLRL